MSRNLAALWGVAGFSGLIVSAMIRLGTHTSSAVSQGLGALEWVLLIGFCLLMAFAEGYRGFQLKFSPRFASRIVRVRDGDSLIEALAAPLYAMGFFRATRRQMITTYVLTLLILVFIFVFRTIPQPWRGILDAGVVVGLGYGLLATWVCTVQAWRCRGPRTDGSAGAA